MKFLKSMKLIGLKEIVFLSIGLLIGLSTVIAVKPEILGFSHKNVEQNNIATELSTNAVEAKTQEIQTTNVETNSPDTSNPSKKVNNKSSTTTPANSSNSNSTPAVEPAPIKPAVLENCTFVNGSKAGHNCPISPPPSWTSSSQFPCYAPGSRPTQCPSYDKTTSITGGYGQGVGVPYCTFRFSNDVFKNIEVWGNTHEIPDCSSASHK